MFLPPSNSLPRAKPPDRGFTLIEAMIVFCLMIVAFLSGLVILEQTRTGAEQATAVFSNEDRARGVLAGIFDAVAETSISYVDTAMRIHGPNVANDIFSDRFTIPGVSLRQCTSPTCAFHTRDDFSIFPARFTCAWEYRTGLLGGSVARGKIWPGTMTACPLDGWALSTSPRFDGVKFFVARTEAGQFTKGTNGSPIWGGLVFIFPCASARGLCELRRYDVYVSDLLAGSVSYSPGWTRFPPLAPSMLNLFDFGVDGTTNGAPDGKVPLTNILSDAASETFTAGTYLGEPAILVSKSLQNGPAPGGFPKRSLTLTINLETGETEFSVDQRDTNTLQWSASCSFTRAPKTLIQGITELAISTSVSDPYDALTNPTGVSEPGSVRVTIATSNTPGADKWFNQVESFKIKTRN
jgi:hypothetical protein